MLKKDNIEQMLSARRAELAGLNDDIIFAKLSNQTRHAAHLAGQSRYLKLQDDIAKLEELLSYFQEADVDQSKD